MRAARELAVERLREKRDFKTHLVVYAAVNAFLWLLWVFTDSSKSGVPWPVWPTMGSGIGIAISAWSVYGNRPNTEDDIRREIERGGRVA